MTSAIRKAAAASQNSLAEMEKKVGELKVLTPLSDEETRKLLPAELAGRKRGEVRMGDLLGKKAQAALQRGEGRAALVQLTTKIESGRLRSASPPC